MNFCFLSKYRLLSHNKLPTKNKMLAKTWRGSTICSFIIVISIVSFYISLSLIDKNFQAFISPTCCTLSYIVGNLEYKVAVRLRSALTLSDTLLVLGWSSWYDRGQDEDESAGKIISRSKLLLPFDSGGKMWFWSCQNTIRLKIELISSPRLCRTQGPVTSKIERFWVLKRHPDLQNQQTR